MRVEPSLKASATVTMSFGNPLFTALRFDAFGFEVGPKLGASFAPYRTQIVDPTYASDYKLSVEAKANILPGLSDAARLLGLRSVLSPEFSFKIDVAASPRGFVTADRTTFSPGQSVNFAIKVDPATSLFFPGSGPYNINRIVLVRSISGVPNVVATAAASPGQTDFRFSYLPSDSGQTSDFYAFVVTQLLPLDLLALKLGKVDVLSVDPALATVAFGTQKTFVAKRNGVVDSSIVWSATGGTITSAGVYTAGSTGGLYAVSCGRQRSHFAMAGANG